MTSSLSGGARNPGQLFLDFPKADETSRPVIETGSYASAVTALRRWRLWPGGQFAIVGERQSGRTRLLRLWAEDAGAALVTGEALARAEIDEIARLSVSALAVDDADHPGAALGLLAALNLCRDRLTPLLLSGRRQPAAWFSSPPDLRSRLSAMPLAAIDPPDDATLAARLREECILRHLNIPEESVNYLAQRMEPSWEAVGRVADQIARTPGRAEGLRSARAVLLALGMDPG